MGVAKGPMLGAVAVAETLYAFRGRRIRKAEPLIGRTRNPWKHSVAGMRKEGGRSVPGVHVLLMHCRSHPAGDCLQSLTLSQRSKINEK